MDKHLQARLDAIRDLEDKREEIDCILRRKKRRLLRAYIVETSMPVLSPHSLDFSASSPWRCPTSPIDLCVYNSHYDRAWDNCIFCNLPYERK